MAKTGQGKTLAFAIPILQELSVDPYGVFAVVLTPTRELAAQIGDSFSSIGAGMALKVRSDPHGAVEKSQRGESGGMPQQS